eukprot:COSAG04_NODE_1826_length_5485_cov_2.733569_8_plen_650_part_00
MENEDDPAAADVPGAVVVAVPVSAVQFVPSNAAAALPSVTVPVVRVAVEPTQTEGGAVAVAVAAPVAPVRVDTDALTGLRGLAALHVAVGHFCLFSEIGVDLMGGASMPFFYLLSGFVMTLGYSGGTEDTVHRRKFYQNRCARLAPVHYATNAWALAGIALFGAAAVGMPGLDTPKTIVMVALTALNLNSWLAPFYGIPGIMPPNAVAWTISTLGFFYLVFPCILPRIKRLHPHYRFMSQMYWAQVGTWFCFGGVFSFWLPVVMCDCVAEWGEEPPGATGCPAGWFPGGSWYWAARAFPLSRLPLFVAGSLAALHRMADPPPTTAATAAWATRRPPEQEPMASFCCGCCGQPDSCCSGGTEEDWVSRSNKAFQAYLTVVGLAVLNETEGFPVGGRIWLEIFIPWLQLVMILTLTRDGGRSMYGTRLRSKPMQFLGRTSMAFYMVHMMVFGCMFLLMGVEETRVHSGGLRESGGSSWESVGSGGRCPDGGPRNLTLDSGGNSTELVLYGCAPMLSFDDAEAWCVERGGHLPSVRSEEELGAMAAIVGPVSGFCPLPSFGQECTVWTGLHKLGSSGGCSWRWTDAPNIDYGQPWPDFIHIDVSATELLSLCTLSNLSAECRFLQRGRRRREMGPARRRLVGHRPVRILRHR